jgi:hypothetical protein
MALAWLVAGCGGGYAEPPVAQVPVAQVQVAAAFGDDDAVEVAGEEGDDDAFGAAEVQGVPVAGGVVAEVDREMALARRVRYSHHTCVDETTGTFEYDCSGLLDYVLRRTAPDALAAVPSARGRRPRAADFVAFLGQMPPGGQAGRWQRVARVQDLAPGDVIAWLRPPESRSSNTGHVMIVHGPVASDPSHPGGFVVPIADSTERPHTPFDSRSDRRQTGLGTGQIVLFADASGAPRSFLWSLSRKAHERQTTIVLGRIR